MKLTEKDKAYLRECGHRDDDFHQIELAMQKRYTKYDLDGKPITREQVIELIGREDYLSGVGRSAFHYTASRETDDGKEIGFDSSNLFK